MGNALAQRVGRAPNWIAGLFQRFSTSRYEEIAWFPSSAVAVSSLIYANGGIGVVSVEEPAPNERARQSGEMKKQRVIEEVQRRTQPLNVKNKGIIVAGFASAAEVGDVVAAPCAEFSEVFHLSRFELNGQGSDKLSYPGGKRRFITLRQHPLSPVAILFLFDRV
nr:hypothetical protein [Mesorhizobium tamadayense]